MIGRECPPPPPPTPVPCDVSVYYGWYSEAQQQLRVGNPTVHWNSRTGRVVQSPPYTYYLQGDRRVLVTEITHSSLPTIRQQKNGDVCVGRVDGYWGRGGEEGGYASSLYTKAAQHIVALVVLQNTRINCFATD